VEGGAGRGGGGDAAQEEEEAFQLLPLLGREMGEDAGQLGDGD